jgi:hypothetical protein
MPMIDVQAVTLVEAGLLVASNLLGGSLALLAWRVSDVDVHEAATWKPTTHDDGDAARLRHNRRIVTEDARYGEARRLQCHVLIAVVGLFWILTPQPINPAVTGWAVVIRAVVILLSGLMIDKTVHHLIARWRFDHPASSPLWIVNVWPALRLAWRDWRAKLPAERRTS